MSRKLRLAWVSTYNAHCGIAAHSAHLLEFFSTDAFEVTVIADDQPLAGPEPENVVRIWTHEGIARITDFIIANKFDVAVFQHHPAFYSFAGLAGMLLKLSEAGIPTFLELHQTTELERIDRNDVRSTVDRGLTSCTRIFLHNLDDVNRLKKLNISENIVLLPLGVPSRAPMDGNAIRSLLGISHFDPVIGAFGFLLPHKGLLELIHAFALLLRTYPAAYLLMLNADYGNKSSKEEYERCLALIRMLELTDKVRLINEFMAVDEILLMLSACHVIAYPYQVTEESASAAVRFGLAAGRPVVTTPLPVFSDLGDVVHQLPGRHPADIAAGIAALLADPERQQQVVERQRRWVTENSWAAQAARIANIILGSFEDARQVELRVPTPVAPPAMPDTAARSAVEAAVVEPASPGSPPAEETSAVTGIAADPVGTSRKRRPWLFGRFDLPSRRLSPERLALVRADRARDAHDWDTAARYYREALLLVPDNAAAWVQYGHALKEAGDPAAAESAYRKSLELDRGVADTHLQLGHALKIQGRKIEAGAAYVRALTLDRSLEHAASELKALGWREGRIQLALRSEAGLPE